MFARHTHLHRRHVYSGVLRSDLVEQDSVALGILNVSGEVVDPARRAGLLEVVVEPAKENLFGRESEKIIQRLTCQGGNSNQSNK